MGETTEFLTIGKVKDGKYKVTRNIIDEVDEEALIKISEEIQKGIDETQKQLDEIPKVVEERKKMLEAQLKTLKSRIEPFKPIIEKINKNKPLLSEV